MKTALARAVRGKLQVACLLQSRLGQNIVTNYLTVVWMGGLSLGLIPFYLRRLGDDQWGIVAICVAIQSFINLLDAGLGQIMPRDVARVAGNSEAEARVFHVFSIAYLGLGTIGFLIGQLSVPWLVGHWFNNGTGVSTDATLALRLVLVQFLFQFANNAHVGFWNGLQSQKLANFRQAMFGTSRHLGAVFLVYWWRADAVAYLLPFALISGLEWSLNRWTILHTLRGQVGKSLTIQDFRILSGEVWTLAFAVLVGMLVSQIDRLVLSRTVDIASFGRYVVVANLGLAFMQLQHPLMRAFFPRIVREAGGTTASSAQLRLAVIVMCVFPCLLAAVFAHWILLAWTKNVLLTSEGTWPLRLILIAVAMNAVYHVIYQKMLVFGLSGLIVIINLISLVIVTPMIIFFSDRIGIVAGGLGWFVGSIIQVGIGTAWLVVHNIKHSRRDKQVL